MTATYVVHLRCDNPKCGREYEFVGHIINARRYAKAHGWTCRPHLEGQVDLCSTCSTTFVTNPTNKGGRPRKVRASD